MASLGSLVIELAANTARLQSDLGKAVSLAQSAASKFSSIFKGIAVFAGAGSLGEVVTHSIELGDSLNKAAIKAGTTGRAMSELAYAAKLSDVDVSSLSTAIKKMQVALSEAATGGKQQQQTLAALGLTLKDLKGLAPDQQFELLADRINKLKDPADRARASVELFGKAGSDLLPLFEQGADGIRKAREEAQRLGASFSDEQIKKLANADDAIKRLKASWEGFATALTSKAAPAISFVLDLLRGELPKAGLDTQIANINYQISRLEGTTADRGIKKLQELRAQLILLQNQQNPYEDFAARRSKAQAAGGSAVGFEQVNKSAADAEAADKQFKSLSESIVGYAQDASRATDQMVSGFASGVQEGFDDAVASQERRDKYFKESMEEQAKLAKKTTEEISTYAKRAAQNSQDAFANFLFDPFKDGLKGMLKSFTDTIRRLVAEAAAAKIFGSKKSGGFGLGDFISSGVDALFGGFKAEGGPLNQGKWYVAGEHGPEPVWGGGAGAFATGYGKGGGGMTVNIDARGATEDGAKRLERYIPAIIQQAAQQAHVMTLNTFSRS